jgi:hypothetical protein
MSKLPLSQGTKASRLLIPSTWMKTHNPAVSGCPDFTNLQRCTDRVNPKIKILNHAAPARGAASLASKSLRVHKGFKTFVDHLLGTNASHECKLASGGSNGSLSTREVVMQESHVSTIRLSVFMSWGSSALKNTHTPSDFGHFHPMMTLMYYACEVMCRSIA